MDDVIPVGSEVGSVGGYSVQEIVQVYQKHKPMQEVRKGVVRPYYTTRIIHIPWRLVHKLIGAISHYAWCVCVKEGQLNNRGRVPFDVIRAKRSEIAKGVFRELLIRAIDTGSIGTQ